MCRVSCRESFTAFRGAAYRWHCGEKPMLIWPSPTPNATRFCLGWLVVENRHPSIFETLTLALCRPVTVNTSYFRACCRFSRTWYCSCLEDLTLFGAGWHDGGLRCAPTTCISILSCAGCFFTYYRDTGAALSEHIVSNPRNRQTGAAYTGDVGMHTGRVLFCCCASSSGFFDVIARPNPLIDELPPFT